MGLETATYIPELNVNNPVHLTDQVGEGDDHLRLIKLCLQNSFENFEGSSGNPKSVTLTEDQINDAALKSASNTFTAKQIIEYAAPNLLFSETGAAIDNGKWRFLADAEQFTMAVRSDDEATGTAFMSVDRTGINVSQIGMRAGTVAMTNGALFKIFDVDNTDAMTIDVDSNDANIRFVDGTVVDLNIDFGQALTGQIKMFTDVHLVSGADLQIRDDTNSDTVTFSHDGTNLNVEFVNTSVILFRDGINLNVYDSTDNAWIGLRHEGANGIIDTNSLGGEVEIRTNNVSRVMTQVQNASGNTSALQTKDHDGEFKDVGFNILAIKTSNANATLNAGHCGEVFYKSTTTERTLTLEANTSTDFPSGGVCTLVNIIGTGNIVVAEGAGTTLYYLDGSARIDTDGGCTVGPGGVATLWRIDANTYAIFGTGITP